VVSLLAARFASVALALALDLAIGDPHYRLHPVRLLGAAIHAAENVLRRTPLPERVAGFLLAFGVTLFVSGVTLAITTAAHAVAPAPVAIAVDAVLVYFALAARALADEGRAVMARLDGGDLKGARERLAFVVGRDTVMLEEPGVARAAIETLAENSVDALIAPVFWALLLGPAGAWLHKSASTLDSMVGYRNERYLRFGAASARLDDVLAYVPARLSVALIAATAFVAGLNAGAALRIGFRDRLKHASPNSAHGEAAFAGALGVSLGGEVSYGGIASTRPKIAQELREPRAEDIRSGVTLLTALEIALMLAFVVATALVAAL
jgi:adenosylcobinamide-phosphate synthase